MQFSIDSFHKDVFNAVRPGKNDRRDYYSQAFANILSFIIENELAGHPIYTSVSVMDEPARPERAAEQIDFWRPLLDNVFQDSLNNFGGNISSNETPTARPQCCHVYEYMYITADGKVRGCCLDAKGLYIVGDFNTQSVPEIWHGEPMRRIRVANDRPAEIDSFDLNGLDCKGCDAPIKGNGLGDSLVSIDRIAERFQTWKSMRDSRDLPNSDRISLAESYLEQLRSRGEIFSVLL